MRLKICITCSLLLLLVFFIQAELYLMFTCFFGTNTMKRQNRGRMFISGPLECVELNELTKFFIAEAETYRHERIAESTGTRRYYIRLRNPDPNIRAVMENDTIDALENFRHKQFIFAKFSKTAVKDRFVDYLNRLIL